jgi:hypothetical protein
MATSSPYADGTEKLQYDVSGNMPGYGTNAKPAGGSYWRGNDGNVWVAGANGTNSAGAWDANSDSYWGGQGYTPISDPLAAKVSNGAFTGPANGGAAQSRANSQIQSINQLLGLIGSKRDSGIGDINSSAAEQRRLLDEQRQSAMTGYDNQNNQNLQSRERGYQQVDNFANDSRNSLNRVFQGANSGNSSVARLLAPSLVGKAAGERRSGVTETANQNEQGILSARKDAENQFNYSGQDLENQRASQEKSFRESLLNQESDLLGKRLAYQQDAGQATDGTQNEINDRMAQLNALFGQFKPSYNVRATPTQKVDLNSFSVDPAQFRLDQSQPAESRYYNPLLKKKEQGLA